jgi:site-specific DNA-methyltransferase (adenine-specific)
MNELYCHNFFENNLKDNSIDCIVTDPPYLINYKHWDVQDVGFHSEWLKECYRVLKPGGTIWSFMASTEVFNFYPLFNSIFEVDLKNWIVWARQKGRGSSKHLKSQREDIFYGIKSGGKKTWNSMKMLREVIAPYVKNGRPRGWFLDANGNRVRWTGLGNVFVYSSPQFNSITEKQLHPAQKPVMIIERLIRLSSNENDVILDPFMGSGTTSIACKLSNRKFIGFEKDKNIFITAKKRIDEFDITKYSGYNYSIDNKLVSMIDNREIKDKKQICHIRNNISKI